MAEDTQDTCDRDWRDWTPSLDTTPERMAYLRKLHTDGALTAEELQLLADYYLEEL